MSLQGKIAVQQLDLADLSSIKVAADALAASLPRLDLLILNAGVMACPQGCTKDGFEMQVCVWALAHLEASHCCVCGLRREGGGMRVPRGAHHKGRFRGYGGAHVVFCSSA